MAYLKTDLGNSLRLFASGKVRELYEVDDRTLLFVASDRISAYDVIMENVRNQVLNLLPVTPTLSLLGYPR